MYECKLCGKEFKSTSSYVPHVKKHGFRTKEELKNYYDQYVKEENEEYCNLERCNNLCNFIGITQGYSKFCCKSHSAKKQMRAKDRIEIPQGLRDVINKRRRLKQEKIDEEEKHTKKIINDALNGIFKYENVDATKKCLICGYKLKGNGSSVSFHVLKKHGLTADEYKNLFLYKRRSFKNYCKFCGKEIGANSKFCNSIDCKSSFHKEVWDNKSNYEKELITSKISFKQKGVSKPQSEETIRKIKENNPWIDPVKAAKLKRDASERMTRKILNGEFDPHANYKQGYINIKKCRKTIFYRSSIEKDFLDQVDIVPCIKELVYEPFRCKYLVIENGIQYERYTIPDLLIKTKKLDYIGEIKPFEFLENPYNCWDKFIIQKLRAILNFSKQNENLDNPFVITVKDEEIYFIDLQTYLLEVVNNGDLQIESFSIESEKDKVYKI